MAVKVKICGMRDIANMAAIASLRPDYMGFIFYKKSPRYVGNDFRVQWPPEMAAITKVAVLVNETLEDAKEILRKNAFDAVQLHGAETAAYCHRLKDATGLQLIKSFGVEHGFDFQALKEWEPAADYFLFDALTKTYGGSGKVFRWEQLADYPYEKPFLLSGGLQPDNLEAALELSRYLPLHALDLNSRYESKPGVKDVQRVAEAIKLIKQFKNDNKR